MARYFYLVHFGQIVLLGAFLLGAITHIKFSFLQQDDVDVVDLLRQGKVGQPYYDFKTKEIRANPKATSDVTREVRLTHSC